MGSPLPHSWIHLFFYYEFGHSRLRPTRIHPARGHGRKWVYLKPPAVTWDPYPKTRRGNATRTITTQFDCHLAQHNTPEVSDEETSLPRPDQLRSGYYSSLKNYREKVAWAKSNFCPQCNQDPAYYPPHLLSQSPGLTEPYGPMGEATCCGGGAPLLSSF